MAYNVVKSTQIVSAGDMSLSITSAVLEITNQDNVGLELVWTGAPVGTFDVQVSIDYLEDAQGNVINAGHWLSLPLSTAVSAAGSGDSAYIDLNQVSALWLRVVYTSVSGTGVLNAFAAAKGV